MNVCAVALIIFAICDELQGDKFPEEICIKYDYNNGYMTKLQPYSICDLLNRSSVSVQSVYVAKDFVQLFIQLDDSREWPLNLHGRMFYLNAEARLVSGKAYPEYVTESTYNQSGRFIKVGAFGEDEKLEEVSASFLHFSDCVNEFGYLILGRSAYEFVIREHFYWPSGKVKETTDFFQADYRDEVVSVALIKWVEKDKIKDHALYKIIRNTGTKFVKSYFKLTSNGTVISLNSEPYLPSAKVMDDTDQLDLLEESALYYVRELNKLSMGYQFTPRLAFPIYYDYNPETNTYKEYPMRTNSGFNTELEKLANGKHVPYWNRYIVPTETWLGCRDKTFCLSRSFDAIFVDGFLHQAILGNLYYMVEPLTSKPTSGQPLAKYFSERCTVDAAFSLKDMVFFIKEDNIYYKNLTQGSAMTHSKLTQVFPGIECTSLSAVITIDKVQVVGKVIEKQPEPSHLESARLRKSHRIQERATERLFDTNPQNVYVYCSTKDSGNVYQYEIETEDPPKFKLNAKKPFKEINAALPLTVSLVFTTEDKVVTMVHHFMIEQSSQTFFTQTENKEQFTLVNKYFSCKSSNVENKLSKDFVQEYIKFAAPKPGATVEPDLTDAGDKTEPPEPAESTEFTPDGYCPKSIDTSTKKSENVSSTFFSDNSETVSSTEETDGSPTGNDAEDENEVKSSAISALQVSSATFIIEAVVILRFIQILL